MSSVNKRARARAIAMINHSDAVHDEASYAPNVVVTCGDVAMLLLSRPKGKPGDGYSVSRSALRDLRSDWEGQVIEEVLFVFERDGEFVEKVLDGLPHIGLILRHSPLPGSNGRGDYNWINQDAEVVPPQRQRRVRRADPDD